MCIRDRYNSISFCWIEIFEHIYLIYLLQNRIHQVNSKANEMKQNVAVNIWFKHTKDHQPGTCKLSAEEATLDKFYFVESEKSQADIDGRAPPEQNPRFVYCYWLIFQKKIFCLFEVSRFSTAICGRHQIAIETWSSRAFKTWLIFCILLYFAFSNIFLLS